jgi:hypothetical protein
MLLDIQLTFDGLLCHTMLQIKFEFGFCLLIFHEGMALGLTKISRFIVFRTFFLRAFRYSFDIGTLLFHTNIKFEFGFGSLIFHEVMAFGLRKISRIISFLPFFSLCLRRLAPELFSSTAQGAI